VEGGSFGGMADFYSGRIGRVGGERERSQRPLMAVVSPSRESEWGKRIGRGATGSFGRGAGEGLGAVAARVGAARKRKGCGARRAHAP
jgi:hypothetical protein